MVGDCLRSAAGSGYLLEPVFSLACEIRRVAGGPVGCRVKARQQCHRCQLRTAAGCGGSALLEGPETFWQAASERQCIDRIEFRNYVCDRNDHAVV